MAISQVRQRYFTSNSQCIDHREQWTEAYPRSCCELHPQRRDDCKIPDMYDSNILVKMLYGQLLWMVGFHVRGQKFCSNQLNAVCSGTEGLVRGRKATDTGSPIMIPVGPGTLGRIMNVTGDPIDERGPIKHSQKKPIHADAPEFVEQSTSAEVLVTGIKVVDLLAPYARGGKIGLFGGAGVGKTVFIQELIVRDLFIQNRVTAKWSLTRRAEQYRQSSWWVFSIYRCRRTYS